MIRDQLQTHNLLIDGMVVGLMMVRESWLGMVRRTWVIGVEGRPIGRQEAPHWAHMLPPLTSTHTHSR